MGMVTAGGGQYYFYRAVCSNNSFFIVLSNNSMYSINVRIAATHHNIEVRAVTHHNGNFYKCTIIDCVHESSSCYILRRLLPLAVFPCCSLRWPASSCCLVCPLPFPLDTLPFSADPDDGRCLRLVSGTGFGGPRLSTSRNPPFSLGAAPVYQSSSDVM
jgi:hypothetical protein